MKPLELSDGAREELESLARSRSLPAGLVRRAKTVLLSADGLSNGAVAEQVGLSRQTVGKWRERFRTQGLMGLYEERRCGRPRSIKDDEVMALLQKTLETKPPDGSTHWSCRSLGLGYVEGVTHDYIRQTHRRQRPPRTRRPPRGRQLRHP